MSNGGYSPAAGDYNNEFCSYPDDAWYSVRVVGDGEKLTVKYYNFSDEHDNVFEANNFKSVKELEDFERRFRQVSVQVQDTECSKLVEGKRVCASLSFNDFDIRFYDAVVEAVEYNEHSFANGEEECRCKFLICWQHGPNVGNLTEKKIESVCLVQCSEKIDPALSSFLKLAREKIQHREQASSPSVKRKSTFSEQAGSPSVKHKSTFAQRITQETKCARRSVGKIWPSEGRISNLSERIRQDTDVGGVDERYIMLVENIEKELSSSTIVEFIHKQMGIAIEAYIFPSLSCESYTRGLIMLDCERDLENLYCFLDNPNHLIVSSRGRPWVVMEKMSGHETFRASTQTFMLKSQIRVVGNADELKIVRSGTEEYRTAKQLRDLFMDFADHQQRLHKKLATEERKILQSSQAV